MNLYTKTRKGLVFGIILLVAFSVTGSFTASQGSDTCQEECVITLKLFIVMPESKKDDSDYKSFMVGEAVRAVREAQDNMFSKMGCVELKIDVQRIKHVYAPDALGDQRARGQVSGMLLRQHPIYGPMFEVVNAYLFNDMMGMYRDNGWITSKDIQFDENNPHVVPVVFTGLVNHIDANSNNYGYTQVRFHENPPSKVESQVIVLPILSDNAVVCGNGQITQTKPGNIVGHELFHALSNIGGMDKGLDQHAKNVDGTDLPEDNVLRRDETFCGEENWGYTTEQEAMIKSFICGGGSGTGGSSDTDPGSTGGGGGGPGTDGTSGGSSSGTGGGVLACGNSEIPACSGECTDANRPVCAVDSTNSMCQCCEAGCRFECQRNEDCNDPLKICVMQQGCTIGCGFVCKFKSVDPRTP